MNQEVGEGLGHWIMQIAGIWKKQKPLWC
jgi:hypothetical protein